MDDRLYEDEEYDPDPAALVLAAVEVVPEELLWNERPLHGVVLDL